MNRPIKLLFDECLTGPVVEQLCKLLAYSKRIVEHKLLPDIVKRGTTDDEWVPKIKDDGFIVVTGDSGRIGGTKGTKLPFVCQRYSVTYVMLSGSIQQKSGFEKARAFMAVWEEVCELYDKPPGSGWLIKMVGERSYRLVKKELPAPKPRKPRPDVSSTEPQPPA